MKSFSITIQEQLSTFTKENLIKFTSVKPGGCAFFAVTLSMVPLRQQQICGGDLIGCTGVQCTVHQEFKVPTCGHSVRCTASSAANAQCTACGAAKMQCTVSGAVIAQCTA